MTTTNLPAPANAQQQSVTPFDADNGGLQITDSGQMVRMADYFSRSELVPQCYRGKPANILVAWQKGAEVGLSPTQALDGIAVINGRASVWGEAATALVLSSGLCEKHSLTYRGTGDDLTAVCTVKRKGMEPESFEFSVSDAKKAGLWGKGTYKSYPKDMLGWKAKSRAYRNQFADCLKGMMIREDMEGGMTGRRYVANTAPADPPEQPQTDPALDDMLGDAPEPVIDAEYQEQHEAGDAFAEELSPPDQVVDMPRWLQIAGALAMKHGVSEQQAEERIAEFAGKVFQNDPSELTTEQLNDIQAKVESGDLGVG